ncbi:MAG: DNA polymerase I [Candidatus Borkfalkiaceae bacterium]|nr:DNA polymerase I [Christensenellaceae bacterium]
MNKLVLIDGNSLINRAFYATPPLSAKDGTPTNAVYAFVNMLVRIIGDIKPRYMLVAFDRKEPTFRHEMYADYKGTRKPMPEDLRPQIDLMKKVLDTMGISRYEQAGIEADDIIGSMAKRYKGDTIIITGDKDSFQLVDETTSVYFTRRGITETEIYSNENFKEKTGIEPIQIIDLKSMMGDSSDNIPGIAGVGEKTALSLVEKYGSLENLYSHIDELSGKLKEKVENSKDIAYLSKTLATINVKLDIPVKDEDMGYSFPFGAATKKLFIDLDFKNVLRREELFLADDEISVSVKKNKELPEIIEVNDVVSLPKFDEDKLLAVNLGDNLNVYDGEKEYKINITDNFFDKGIMYGEAVRYLEKLVEKDKRNFIVYAKKDLRTELNKFKVAFNAFAYDVAIEKYLADFSGKDEKLSEVIAAYDLDKDRIGWSLNEIHDRLFEKLKTENMLDLYEKVELPLSDVLFSMERSGFKVDVATLNEMANEYDKRIAVIAEKIDEYAGEKVNPNSPKQLGKILYDKLGLISGKKKGNPSTSADVLEKIADKHPIVPLILKYRQLQKLNSTYIKGFRPLIDEDTGLIHTCFNQTLTTTGRLSSKEPNLQNIPVREQEGKEIRKLFVSSFENGKIVGADYSQIELRLLAHFSKCQPLIDAFLSGKDIHRITASQVFGVGEDQVTPEMRRSAKAVNFGIIYGISDYGLSEQLKISPKKAGEYIAKYFEAYPHVKEYMNSNVEFARKNGYVSTLLGRKRYIPEINSSNFNLRSFGERAAMNMPLQGTAADVIKIAMIKVANRIKKEGLRSRLILQVHDELIVDTAEDEVEEVKNILVEEMQSAVTLSVPLTVETECGTRWFDAK